ncbi:MAG: sulfotransferase domain-containing protein [Alphaproteobacteria bacterium]|nr:hypothetical protein [Rhodospirillaceae bacterium]MDG2479957.1 sulfotransferase domain-containing protein [Alphaproteobacteria bacterium]MBT6203300.1 hypothetical protein [Rhodospirillaceae bacterium]MBT6510146.1 hypothetical protein [Rhodospirillaceae bacterium]MBT7614428.1 hypothetical protein [Rhodospirillaceae bacterium]
MTTPSYVLAGSPRQAPQLLGSWSQNVESWTAQPNPALHVMRYEDMLADPLRAFTGLTGFLGLKAADDKIDEAIERSSFKTLQDQEERQGFAERGRLQKQFFRKGRSGSWREELSDEQVVAIVQHNRAQMARFGYLPDGM